MVLYNVWYNRTKICPDIIQPIQAILWRSCRDKFYDVLLYFIQHCVLC